MAQGRNEPTQEHPAKNRIQPYKDKPSIYQKT